MVQQITRTKQLLKLKVKTQIRRTLGYLNVQQIQPWNSLSLLQVRESSTTPTHPTQGTGQSLMAAGTFLPAPVVCREPLLEQKAKHSHGH